MSLNGEAVVFTVVLSAIILAPIIWLAGRGGVGSTNVRFVDALFITAIGTIVGVLMRALVSGILTVIIQLIIWLSLVKYYFTRLSHIIKISILSVIIFIAITFGLALLGSTLFTVLV